jgi:cysteine synthase B
MKLVKTSHDSLKEQVLNLGSYIGETPLFELKRIFHKPGVEVYAKLEWQQMGGSVKARPAWNIIQAAILSGKLIPGRRLLDASSGNTAIAYASIAANLGIPVTICLPENASPERKMILRSLGAELILTSPFEGTDGAQEAARELKRKHPDLYYYADQYSNEYNWRAHYVGTGPEIFRQTGGRVTHFVAGLGTTGTFTGTGRRLKELNPDVKLISLQPDSPMHGLEGWKHLETAHVPSIYDRYLGDLQYAISSEEAYELLKEVARWEGLLISPSAAANLAGALKVASGLEKGVVVTLFPDDASKYQETVSQIINE